MQEKFLPKLKKIAKDLLNKILKKNQQSDQELKNKTVNLLTAPDTSNIFPEPRLSVEHYFTHVVFIVLGLFILLFLTDATYNNQLKKINLKLNEVTNEIEALSSVEQEAAQIYRLTETYKGNKSTSRKISSQVATLINSNDAVTLKAFDYSKEKNTYNISLTSNEVISFAYYIASVLDGGFADSIVINSVALDNSDSAYVASLTVNIR